MGIECFRVQFPKGQDANEYALKVTPATRSLGVLLTGAAWMGKGSRPAGRVPVPVIVAEPPAAAPPIIEPLPAEVKSTAKEKIIEEPMPGTNSRASADARARPRAREAAAREAFSSAVSHALPEEPASVALCRCLCLAEAKGRDRRRRSRGKDDYSDAREYRVLWLEKSTVRGRMQVNVKVSGNNVRGESAITATRSIWRASGGGRRSSSRRRTSWR